jgi:hypothetical protein
LGRFSQVLGTRSIAAVDAFGCKRDANSWEYVQYSTDSGRAKPHDGFAKGQTGKTGTEIEAEYKFPFTFLRAAISEIATF